MEMFSPSCRHVAAFSPPTCLESEPGGYSGSIGLDPVMDLAALWVQDE